MNKYKLSITGLLVSVIVYLVTRFTKYDLFENFIKALQNFERHEIDEFIIPVVIFMIFLLIELFRKNQHLSVENEKIKIYKAMLRSIHYILNNFLNQMELFLITAQDIEEFPDDILALYEDISKNANAQIEALSKISSINPSSIEMSILPKSNG